MPLAPRIADRVYALLAREGARVHALRWVADADRPRSHACERRLRAEFDYGPLEGFAVTLTVRTDAPHGVHHEASQYVGLALARAAAELRGAHGGSP